MSAPHLPPKTNSISNRQRVMFARRIFVVLIIALLAGATAALSVLAWYPHIIGYATPYGPYYFDPIYLRDARPPGDVLARARTIQNATVLMFRARDVARSSGVSFYPADRAIGYGVFLTDDGWLLTAGSVAQASTDLRIIDSRGAVHTVTEVVQDPVTGLSFIKIEGSGFTVVPVSDGNLPHVGDTLYRVVGSTFASYTVGIARAAFEQPLASNQLDRLFELSDAGDMKEGTPLFDEQGVLVGVARIVNERVVVVPVAAVRSLFSDVFGGREIALHTVQIRYITMPEQIPTALAEDDKAPRVGAYVVEIRGLKERVSPVPSLQRGDIITAVNEEPLTAVEDLSVVFARLRPQQEVLLNVYRDGEQLRVPAVLVE